MKYKQLSIFDFTNDPEQDLSSEKYNTLNKIMQRDLRLIKKYLNDTPKNVLITCSSYKYKWVFNQYGLKLEFDNKIYNYNLDELRQVAEQVKAQDSNLFFKNEKQYYLSLPFYEKLLFLIQYASSNYIIDHEQRCLLGINDYFNKGFNPPFKEGSLNAIEDYIYKISGLEQDCFLQKG